MTERRLIELRFTLSGPDLERLVVVGSDLEYLATLPRDRLFTHTEVRLAASVLRRLFVDDVFGAVWRSLGAPKDAQLQVIAIDIDRPLNGWPERWIKYAWAGGARAGGAHHNGMILADIPKEDHEAFGSPEAFLEANPLPFEGQSDSMTLGSWLDGTSVAIQTIEVGLVRISRRSVLTYIANRKGGVHFDPRRDLSLPKKRSRHRREVESHLLDHGLLRVGHLSGPEYEVMSMVHVIQEAAWARKVVRVATEIAPEDFRGDPGELKFWTGLASDGDPPGWATSRFH